MDIRIYFRGTDKALRCVNVESTLVQSTLEDLTDQRGYAQYIVKNTAIPLVSLPILAVVK